jgi:hypothetical protein
MIVTRHRTIWPALLTVLLLSLRQSLMAADGRPAAPRGAANTSARTAGELGTPDSNHRAHPQVREGSQLVKMPGRFVPVGDSLVFQPQGSEQAFQVLENLALERVWNMLEQNGDRTWTVSGTVTEFRSRNYLLIERAVLKAPDANAPSEP